MNDGKFLRANNTNKAALQTFVSNWNRYLNNRHFFGQIPKRHIESIHYLPDYCATVVMLTSLHECKQCKNVPWHRCSEDGWTLCSEQWATFVEKCSREEHGPWHLVKEASKVTLLIPLVKNQIKHYQGSEETHRQCCLWFALDTFKYHFKKKKKTQMCRELHLLENADLWFQPLLCVIDVHLQVRLSQGPLCHPSLNAYVHPLDEDSIGQLIEQYPGSDKHTARRNSAQWCHLVPCQCSPARALQ